MSSNNLSPLQLACKKLFDIDIDYFEDIQRDGEMLPIVKYPGTDETKELAIDYRDHVVATFKRDIDEILTPEALASATQDDRYAILREIDKISNPQISEEILRDLYNRAKRRTIRERLADCNKSDIIAFHHALMDATVWECQNEVEDKLKKTY